MKPPNLTDRSPALEPRPDAAPTAPPGQQEVAPDQGTGPGRRRVWLCRLGLAGLPLLLVLGFFYRPFLQGDHKSLPVGGDHDFYIYQTSRMGELGGRWWKLGYDDLVGQPFSTTAAKHPGLYEGVDLLLISAVTSRFLDPVVNYHGLMVLALVFNGWVAAWIVRHLTGSYGWAALAAVLITLNMCTDMRVGGNLHLLKYGWVLLATWAFFRYLDAPLPRTGLALGLAGALLLQSSFYFAFFLLAAFAVWWLGCLVSGSLDRRHYAAAAVAGLVFLALGAVLTYPVWRASMRATDQADTYFLRDRQHLWRFSAEPWQYVVSPHWDYSQKLLRSEWGPDSHFEGWNYPGLVVLGAIGLYLLARLRGWRAGGTAGKSLDRLMGLSAILVVLSLWGGPAVLLYDVVPWFRCYGRAGMLAVVLWSVAAPVALHALVEQVPARPLRLAALGVLLGLALYEGEEHRHQLLTVRRTQPDPAWVSWLAGQPADVRLAVFPLAYRYDPATAPDDWLNENWYFLYLRILHQHATLNGCEPAALGAELAARGASEAAMTEGGLRYITSLGYNALAFREDYLQANPEIQGIPWLGSAEVVANWRIYRVRHDEGR